MLGFDSRVIGCRGIRVAGEPTVLAAHERISARQKRIVGRIQSRVVVIRVNNRRIGLVVDVGEVTDRYTLGCIRSGSHQNAETGIVVR